MALFLCSQRRNPKTKYYRIKPEYDNARLLNRAKRTFDGILIGNELYTVKEWEKLVLKYRVSEAVCDIVNVKPKETYWFFGARFQDREE